MAKLGIFSWFGYPLPFADRVRLIKEVGFDSTSLWLDRENERYEDIQPEEMAELAAKFELNVDNVHASYTYCNFLWSESQAEREIITTQYTEGVTFCQKHHIPLLVVHITCGDQPPPVSQTGLDILDELLRYAEESNVSIAIENTRQPAYLNAVFEQSDSPSLRFCYDSSHDFLWGNPPCAVLKKWGHLLATTHFSDNNGIRDDHCLPEYGSIDWNHIQTCFPKETYSGTIHLEVMSNSQDEISPQTFLNRAYQKAEVLRERLKNPTDERI